MGTSEKVDCFLFFPSGRRNIVKEKLEIRHIYLACTM